MLAIIGGQPARFRPYVELYHRALDEFGHERLPVGVHSPGHVAATDEQAARGALAAPEADARPHRRRARLAAVDPRRVRDAADPDGALHVGSPETVARKIATTVEDLGASRFDLKYSAGTLPHET